MFRVMFLIDDAAARQRSVAELRNVTMGGDARIVSAFADAKTVEVFLDIAESALPREVIDRLAHQLVVDEYEVTRVEPVAAEPVGSAATIRRGRLRRAVITQVRVHPDGRTLSVQARHRPDETVEQVEVQQTDDAVGIAVLVGPLGDDDREQYVSFAVAFTWVDAILDRPVGDREIIHLDPGHAATLSGPARHDGGREPSPESPEVISLIEAPESDEAVEVMESLELIESMQLGEEVPAPFAHLGARLDRPEALDDGDDGDDRDDRDHRLVGDGSDDDRDGCDFDFDFGHFLMIGPESLEVLRPATEDATGVQADGELEGSIDSEDERVIALLRPYRDALAGAASGQEPIPFVRKTWRRALKGSGLGANEVDAVLCALPSESIGRNDLRRIAGSAHDTQADLNLFVAAMVWGRGKRNARVVPQVVEAIDDSRRVTVLAETARLATAGDVERAYRAWTLRGLGPPFFTRWLWTASLRGDPGTRPLVLDRQVRRSLKEALGWSTKQAAGTKARAARYRAYCEAVARWAHALSDARTTVSPEDVECALARADGRLRTLEK
jgi:hypothetical protein